MKPAMKIAIASSIVTSLILTYTVCISIGISYLMAIPYALIATSVIQIILLALYLTITLDTTPPKI